MDGLRTCRDCSCPGLGVIYEVSKTKRIFLFRANVISCMAVVPTPCLHLLALHLLLRCLAGLNCEEESW